MNVLSLFDGISCGQIALNRAGIKYDNYFASEIDKHAIKVTQHNYPDTIQIGDVTKVKGEDLPQIDLCIGGSPCQGFSFLGKQLNFDDPRSKLFFEFVRLLHEVKPRYFLLENVVMKKEWQDVISNLLGVEPILINSALVSGQNRKRLYWTNIPNVEQPKDKGIKFADILESGYADREKSLCLLARKEIRKARYFTHYQGQFKFTVQPEKIIDREELLEIMQPITLVERERLQTLPNNYTALASDNQRCIMIGNGWTVDVITHIFSYMKF
jgi:DNA (cytosine-5)-methyltransferase 3A